MKPNRKIQSLPSPVPQATDGDFTVRFWGVRGSIPSAGARTIRYGGNTACIEVLCGTERIILDMGTGCRVLGESLSPPVTASILFSHYHYDHIQGFPFFTPLFDERNTFDIFGPTRDERPVQEVLSNQMLYPFFPIGAEIALRARTNYHEINGDQESLVGEARISALELNHPGGNLSFRIEYRHRSIIYTGDFEHGPSVDGRLTAFAQGADLLIYDATYTEDEYFGQSGQQKAGWGHSTWQAAIRAAERSRARRLVLFHHEPSRTDDSIDALLQEARRLRPDAVAAHESLILSI